MLQNLLILHHLRKRKKTIFNFPPGIKSGYFFHTLLEDLQAISFTEASRDKNLLSQNVQKNLEKYDFDLSWEACITQQIHKLMTMPLLPQQALTLGALSKKHCFSELYFFFILDNKSFDSKSPTLRSSPLSTAYDGANGHTLEARPKKARQVTESLDLDRSPSNHLIKSSLLNNLDKEAIGANFLSSLFAREQLTRTATKASQVKAQSDERFLHGFIDLVFEYDGRFYLLDWKSNFLGASLQDYDRDKLEEDMIRSGYHLQYYIYADALDRYLQLRYSNYQHAKHFGGIFYIYLRGISQSGETGVYTDCPSLQDLSAFRTLYKQ